MSELLEGRKALITGSSRGIGKATALAMAREGADVVVHYNRNEELAEETFAQVKGLGREALLLQADLEQLEEVQTLFDTIKEKWGALDIFMANAAASAFKPILEMKPHHLSRTYDLLIQSLVRSVQLAVPLMTNRRGRVITVSGHGVHYTLPLYASIGSAKGTTETLTRYLSYELGSKGITCNCLAPGVVDTDSVTFYAGERYAEFVRTVSRHTPLGRLATPEDVANVAVFLASDLSRFVSGQVIGVDGGLTHTSGPFEDIK